MGGSLSLSTGPTREYNMDIFMVDSHELGRLAVYGWGGGGGANSKLLIYIV